MVSVTHFCLKTGLCKKELPLLIKLYERKLIYYCFHYILSLIEQWRPSFDVVGQVSSFDPNDKIGNLRFRTFPGISREQNREMRDDVDLRSAHCFEIKSEIINLRFERRILRDASKQVVNYGFTSLYGDTPASNECR